MLIKLEVKKETEKALQLTNNSWIPKSILDGEGLKHPYYYIKSWWISSTVKKYNETKGGEIKEQLEGISKLGMTYQNLPEELKPFWSTDTVKSNVKPIEIKKIKVKKSPNTKRKGKIKTINKNSI